MAAISPEFQERLKKLKELKELNINPYPERYERSHLCSAARKMAEKSQLRDSEVIMKEGPRTDVSLCGRLKTFREHGRLSFGQLQDVSGMMQICFTENVLGKERYKLLKKFDLADFVGVKGELFKTHKGEYTLLVKEYVLLAKALRPLPEKWHGLQDQEMKYRQRYLDMVMDPATMERFLMRTKVINTIRAFLLQHQFLEVETPVLITQASGAVARPFLTHHNALDLDIYLRIATETYLKRCVAGGMERVFEFGKCFRNEGMDPSHLQEFNMLEYYAAYWNYEDNMQFTEKMFEYLLGELFGNLKISCIDREGQEREIDFKTPWPRVKFRHLIKEYCGIDIDQFDNADDLRKATRAKKLIIEGAENMGLGNLFDALYKKVARPQLIQPVFVIQHPVMTKPLARKNDKNPKVCDSFQLLVNTWEIINAYSELIDPIDQRERLEEQSKAKAAGDEEAMEVDEEFLLCMEHGMPPMSGWGMGIDRLCALLSKQDNLKDVVLFPLLRPEHFAQE